MGGGEELLNRVSCLTVLKSRSPKSRCWQGAREGSVPGISCWMTDGCLLVFSYHFSSKEQASFNFMAVVTICSDFGAQENKVSHRGGAA